MGCGCGNLGKLLGRYVESYLGVDYSPMALMIARLVSPENCSYIQVAQQDDLEPHFATIDTVVSRWFWIHQNMKLARVNLEYLNRFLKTGGHLYADFRWPDPAQKQFKVFSPSQPLSEKYPSATFKYTEDDVAALIEGLPFRIVSQEIHVERQARFVRFERI
jgi:ubiquinone/menaquinone biosynthesis C-methylase UbiE